MLLPRTTKPLETSATAAPWLPLAGHVVPMLFFTLFFRGQASKKRRSVNLTQV
jgi:hypothetical protein